MRYKAGTRTLPWDRFRKGLALSPGTLRAGYGGDDRWAIATIYEDGRIRYREVKFTKGT